MAKRLTAVTLLVFVACTPEVFDEETDGIATICGTVGKTYRCGTAWTIDRHGVLVTNAHVIEGWETNTIRYHILDKPPKVHYNILVPIAINKDHDVAFVYPLLPDDYEHYPYEMCDRMRWRSPVVAVGAMHEDISTNLYEGDITYSFGRIAYMSYRRFAARVSAEHGNSGSPVFSLRDGSCVSGMVRGMRGSLMVGARARIIKRLYNQL